MRLKAKTATGAPLGSAKRIYLDNVEIHATCPSCQSTATYEQDVPILTENGDGTWYCHHLYCGQCHFESENPMYQLKSIGERDIDLIFDKQFSIKAFEIVITKKEIQQDTSI